VVSQRSAAPHHAGALPPVSWRQRSAARGQRTAEGAQANERWRAREPLSGWCVCVRGGVCEMTETLTRRWRACVAQRKV
jgi:hypothetical protein